MSIVFDRAVSYYDQTRGLAPERERQIIDSMIQVGEIADASRILEMGIGTGRIALPLAARGRRVFGADLSLPMMQVLSAKQQPGMHIELCRADVTTLPFSADTFDVVYAVHVLHLVAGWQGAVMEARRVLKSGGRFLVNWHRRGPESPTTLIHNELARLVTEQGVDTRRPGAQTEEEIIEQLEQWGVPPLKVPVFQESVETTPAAILDEIDKQVHSHTWSIPKNTLQSVMPRLTEWTVENLGPLDRAFAVENNFGWLVARK